MNKAWLWWGALLAWCFAACLVASDPTSFLGGIVVAGVGLVLALAWLVRLVVALRSASAQRGQLGLEAVVGLAVVGLCYLQVPSTVRFRLSAPTLTAYAKGQLANPQGSQTPVRIGLYTFNSVAVEKAKNEVHLDLGGRFLDRVSFVYAHKMPNDAGSYTRLYGNWYQRIEGW